MTFTSFSRKIKNFIFSRTGHSYIHAENNPLVIYRCYEGEIETLRPVSKTNATPLSDKFIQKPDFIDIERETFDFREPGLYRIYRLPVISEQRLVVTENDPMRVIGSLWYAWMYGNKDDSYSLEQQKSIIKKRTLNCGCHNLSVLAC